MANQFQIQGDSTQKANGVLNQDALKVDLNINQNVSVPKTLFQPTIKTDTLPKKKIVQYRTPYDPLVKFSHEDSIKLNLIELYPNQQHYFNDNTLIRFNNSKKKTELINNSNINIDSIEVALGADSIISINNELSTYTEHSVMLNEKPIAQSVFAEYYSWLIPIIIVIISLTGIIRLQAGKLISQIMSALIYNHAASSLYNSINLKNSAPSFALNVLFLINFGFFLFEIITHFKVVPYGIQGFSLFWIAILLSLTLALIKMGAYNLLGYVFNVKSQTAEFIFHVNLINKVFGLLILPFIILIPFISEGGAIAIIQGGMVLFVMAYLTQIIKGAGIILREPFSVVYMFLYLCALEILPLVILYRIIMS